MMVGIGGELGKVSDRVPKLPALEYMNLHDHELDRLFRLLTILVNPD